MQIEEHWHAIQQLVKSAQASTLHCAIASVAPDGAPNISPIGTVFLRGDQTGYYFDQYTSTLAQHIDAGSSICLMAVNAKKLFWLRSFLFGQFASPPGVRLYGTASKLRPATSEELESVRRRVQPTRWLKGSQLLWSDFTHVRDLRFTSFRPVTYPTMMEGLWR